MMIKWLKCFDVVLWCECVSLNTWFKPTNKYLRFWFVKFCEQFSFSLRYLLWKIYQFIKT